MYVLAVLRSAFGVKSSPLASQRNTADPWHLWLVVGRVLLLLWACGVAQ